ncbi:MAG: hypothetical protein KME14_26810 [Tildeniella torsiva UHER 1998/13D]|jgi:uracil phosphoribosyltransferase|nr:hypothetical protein [Tildeniella torsiva UHER 1998/13D]
MTRQYSALVDADVKQLLNVIADKSTPPQAYQGTMTQLGKRLGSAMLAALENQHQRAYLVATVEDADFLSLGVLKQLETQIDSVGFACFWNQRTTLFDLNALAVAPILKQYQEPANQVDTLIVVKSIISGGCVVKTNLQNLIQTISPQRIFIAAPVLYHSAEAALRQVFSPDISQKFEFFYFAIDDERTDQGEVLPGVGGIIYDRLGFDGQEGKNSYTPAIVKQRRQQFLDRRKVNA